MKYKEWPWYTLGLARAFLPVEQALERTRVDQDDATTCSRQQCPARGSLACGWHLYTLLVNCSTGVAVLDLCHHDVGMAAQRPYIGVPCSSGLGARAQGCGPQRQLFHP
eukprot:scaffold1025_cov381-Prasinococcus_capsulatus_cf.AAC.6